jgi:hypothetical protein
MSACTRCGRQVFLAKTVDDKILELDLQPHVFELFPSEDGPMQYAKPAKAGEFAVRHEDVCGGRGK